MENHKLLIYLIIGFVVVFIGLILLNLYLVVRPLKITSPTTPADLGLEYEEVRFSTSDDVELAGWFIPTEGTDEGKTVIALHGYPADKGNILPSVAPLIEDYNLFLFDFRYLGESGGAYSTVGVDETKDLAAAVGLLEEDYQQEAFGVWGFSVGGAVALMSATDLPQIQAIYTESSYADLRDLAQDVYRTPALGSVMGFLTSSAAHLLLGIDVGSAAPEAHVRELDIPLMLVHSPDDEVIPVEHGERLREAASNNPNMEYISEEGLIHGQIDHDIQQRMRQFFQENL